MKRMDVFMMNTCPIADQTAYQYLFSMFTADQLLFHSSRGSSQIPQKRRSSDEDVVQFRRAARGAALAHQLGPGPTLDWIPASSKSPIYRCLALSVASFPGLQHVRLCARRP